MLSALALSGCAAGPEESKEVTLIVHDSFESEGFAEAASAATGYDVKVITAGGGQELTTSLALTKGAPLADAFFGIDSVFASRLIENDIVEPHKPANLPARAEKYLFDEKGSMVPVSMGATCLNTDDGWFADKGIPAPTSYADLVLPQYKDLTVLLDPTSSTTGASFYIGTIAEFGAAGAIDFWEDLVANGARVEQGWTEAYYSQFTYGAPDGTYPIVVSYSSSPAYTINEDGTAAETTAVLETCSSTFEYAGVLKGANNTAGAKAVVDYLVSREFQDTIAESMYIYPVDEGAKVPEEWEKFAPLPENPRDLPAVEIGENRETWLRDLAETIGL